MTVSEIRATEEVQKQSKKQLEFMYKQLDKVDVTYVLVQQDNMGYIVRREFLLLAIAMELEMRHD